MDKIVCTISAVLMVSLVFLPVIHPHEADMDQSKQVINKSIESMGGLNYSVTVIPSESKVIVNLENPTNRTIKSGYSMRLDSRRITSEDYKIKPGQVKKWSFGLNSTISIIDESHSLIFSTYGGVLRFNFTKRIDPNDPGEVPVTEITAVEMNASDDGTVVLYVTLENPSKQAYPTTLLVYTNETDGYRKPGFVPLGENETTVRIPLEDDPGERISGEIRLYTGNVSDGRGLKRQVSFSGVPGKYVEVEHEEYEPVTPPWEPGSYEFASAPESSEKTSEWGGVAKAVLAAFAVTMGLVALLGSVFRLRGRS